MKNKPGRRRRLLPHLLPSPPDAESILPRRKKTRFTPKSFQEKKETGAGGNRGEEIGKADFSSLPARHSWPSLPPARAPPRRPPLAEPRSLLPGSRRLRGAENTHSRTQLILNRLNQ